MTKKQLEEARNILLDIVKEQSEAKVLWFEAERITEEWLQQELRRLHRAIENNLK